MEWKLIVYNVTSGTTYDYAPVVEKVTFTTKRKLGAGELEFSYIQKSPINMTEGAKVQFYVNGRGIFEGYVFTIEQDREGKVEVTAYDQMRYLKTNESYSFVGKKLGEIIQQIATDMQLRTGILEDTGYVLPMLTKEDTECLDIIDYALGLTQYNTGKTYSVFDDFGKISLREAGNSLPTEIVGNRSLLTDYTFKSDIDSDTYIFNDSGTIKKWGLLQKYEKVDENLNEAQINEQGTIMMAYYDRVLKELSVDSIGILGFRAGEMVTIRINDIPELRNGYRLIAEKVKHVFSQGEHTMSFDARMLNL